VTAGSIVLTSQPAPPGTPFVERELVTARSMLEANGYAAEPAAWRRAAGSDEPSLRAFAFQLLAEGAADGDAARFERALGDRDGAVRAWAAFGLERIRPGAGRPALHELAGAPIEFADYGPLIAAAALARLGDPSGFATLVRAEAEPAMRVPVVQRLMWFAAHDVEAVWPAYARALEGAPVVRELAIMQLRELDQPRAREVLEAFVAAHPAGDPSTAGARAVLAQRPASS
jgi:hypothetical protein